MSCGFLVQANAKLFAFLSQLFNAFEVAIKNQNESFLLAHRINGLLENFDGFVDLLHCLSSCTRLGSY